MVGTPGPPGRAPAPKKMRPWVKGVRRVQGLFLKSAGDPFLQNGFGQQRAFKCDQKFNPYIIFPFAPPFNYDPLVGVENGGCIFFPIFFKKKGEDFLGDPRAYTPLAPEDTGGPSPFFLIGGQVLFVKMKILGNKDVSFSFLGKNFFPGGKNYARKEFSVPKGKNESPPGKTPGKKPRHIL